MDLQPRHIKCKKLNSPLHRHKYCIYFTDLRSAYRMVSSFRNQFLTKMTLAGEFAMKLSVKKICG
jgi:hypothetical protein